MTEQPELIAYYSPPLPEMRVVPAPRGRVWMDETSKRVAHRCLPLLVANEAGWALLNPHACTVTWDGGRSHDAVRVEYDENIDGRRRAALSQFGQGVVSFGVPYLFRTPPGWNLLARPPANWPKDGATGLEGLVETDWAVATFTMNWQLTRPGLPVRFEKDEPICVVVPQRRGEIESFQPAFRETRSDPATQEGLSAWLAQRHEFEVRKFFAEHGRGDAEDLVAWERDYFKGLAPDGSRAPEHQTKLRVQPFAAPEEARMSNTSEAP
jgi:hypothetical protein